MHIGIENLSCDMQLGWILSIYVPFARGMILLAFVSYDEVTPINSTVSLWLMNENSHIMESFYFFHISDTRRLCLFIQMHKGKHLFQRRIWARVISVAFKNHMLLQRYPGKRSKYRRTRLQSAIVQSSLLWSLALSTLPCMATPYLYQCEMDKIAFVPTPRNLRSSWCAHSLFWQFVHI